MFSKFHMARNSANIFKYKNIKLGYYLTASLLLFWIFVMFSRLLYADDSVFWTMRRTSSVSVNILNDNIKVTFNKVYEMLADIMFYGRVNGGQVAIDPVVDLDRNGYVAYLPHSGFSNQLIELENALITAHILNRTLILPPAYIGHSKSFSWKPYPDMKKKLRDLELLNFNKIMTYLPEDAQEFFDHFSYTLDSINNVALIPWSAIIDLKRLNGVASVIDINTFIKLGFIKTTADVLEIRDYDRYAYRIADKLPVESKFIVDNSHNDLHLAVLHPEPFDSTLYWRMQNYIVMNNVDMDGETNDVPVFLGQYSHILNLQRMKSVYEVSVQAKLIHFGSMFGNSRVELASPDYKTVAKEIQEALVLSNSIIEEIADMIISKIGGHNGYLAIHLRLGDGTFVDKAGKSVNMATKTIEKLLKTNNYDIIYIATDIHNNSTLKEELLGPLGPYLPRIRFFSDFHDEIAPHLQRFDDWRVNNLNQRDSFTGIPQWDADMTGLFDFVESLDMRRLESEEEIDSKTTKLKGLTNKIIRNIRQETNIVGPTRFSQMFIPFIEQIVCAYGHNVVGTKGSTFSTIIERMFLHYNSKLQDSTRKFKYI